MLLKIRSALVMKVLLYLFLVLIPLPLGIIGLDPSRGFWVNLSAAFGYVALAMFALQFLLATRSRFLSDPAGMDKLLIFHVIMGSTATVLAFLHPIILLIYNFDHYWPLFNILTSPLRAKFAVLSLLFVMIVIVISVYRRHLNLRYETWQVAHAMFAILVVTTGLMHTVLVGYFVREVWEKTFWSLFVLSFIALLIWVRVIKPLLHYKRRWEVVSVIPDNDNTTKLTIKLIDPESYGPKGFQFKAGQFAWITANKNPFVIAYNPFSFSSGEQDLPYVSFTIKAYEDFSREVAYLKPGQTVYLDGPYGGFVLPAKTDPVWQADSPLLLIGAGIGVTPIVSILKTLAHQQEKRPIYVWLIHKNHLSVRISSVVYSIDREYCNEYA